MQKLAFSPDRLLGNCNSWEHFWAAAASLSKKQKGDLLERLVQLYLLTKPKWLARSEVPIDVRKRLNLPFTDGGIDLIAQTRSGNFWAIQAKFKSNPEKAPMELSTFSNHGM